MRVLVRIRDKQISVNVGPGHQRLKWLAMIALQRYEEARIVEPGILLSHAHVSIGLMDAEGNLLPPNKSIRAAVDDGQEIFALLQADEDTHQKVKGSKGTSKFLMSQGAAPNRCIITGPGVTYALAGQTAFFYLTARDTYGNLARNGGEFFNLKLSPPDTLQAKGVGETPPDEPPLIVDRGDGETARGDAAGLPLRGTTSGGGVAGIVAVGAGVGQRSESGRGGRRRGWREPNRSFFVEDETHRGLGQREVALSRRGPPKHGVNAEGPAAVRAATFATSV